MFLNISVLQGGVVSTSPNPKAGGPPLVGCPRLLIQYIRSYPPYRRPFLFPQPEDAPCRGDRDPLHGSTLHYTSLPLAFSLTPFQLPTPPSRILVFCTILATNIATCPNAIIFVIQNVLTVKQELNFDALFK